MLGKSSFQEEEGTSGDDVRIGEEGLSVRVDPFVSFSKEVSRRSLSKEDCKEPRHKSRKVVHTVRNVKKSKKSSKETG